VRDVAFQALEEARTAKMIGSGLAAHVRVFVEHDGARRSLQQLNASANGVDELRYLFVTSQVTVVDSAEAAVGQHVTRQQLEGLGTVVAAVAGASGTKCERCWNYSEHVGHNHEHPLLCERCSPVVAKLGFKLPATAASSA